ncbi:YoaK family protein [Rhizobium tumorigenes]|uniref:YoaK family protein n=1 Tax=Rhizobium tumorigenes TaxID=2041385 RepID=A0AAF1KSF8_9HYPH|nr:YoaK family protein [Rhizobium tumorigenes]WFR97917.1 YoaK family protein [Rhizobium tumorigenes]
MKKLSLATVLSFDAGYVDTAGFLALQGLFTAHVTGNFVTFGAAVVLGTSGIIAKLLALPVFCAVILVTRLASYWLAGRKYPVLSTMMRVKLVLLILAAVLAVSYGPFPKGDGWPAIVTGMVLVAAMAIQNAAHKIHLAKAPPTTMMTGNTTQIMIDVADIVRGETPEAKSVAKKRVVKMLTSVCAFAIGCGVAAAAFMWLGIWCLAVPPLLGLLALLAETETPEGDAK